MFAGIGLLEEDGGGRVTKAVKNGSWKSDQQFSEQRVCTATEEAIYQLCSAANNFIIQTHDTDNCEMMKL